ncbi:MAG: CSLREA domain-containing protein, partial [Anaerolineales bacterium]
MAKHLVRSLSVFIILALLLGQFGLSPVAAAANFIVNSSADMVDADPGDGLCETDITGDCTLRAAIQETNALVGADTISVPAG